MLLRAAPPPQSADRLSWCASLSRRSLTSWITSGRRGATLWPCNTWGDATATSHGGSVEKYKANPFFGCQLWMLAQEGKNGKKFTPNVSSHPMRAAILTTYPAIPSPFCRQSRHCGSHIDNSDPKKGNNNSPLMR